MKFEHLPDIEIPENGFLCYRITDASSKELESFNNKLLLSNKRNHFCLLVTLEKVTVDFEKVIDSIVPFTFHYNYLKFNYGNPLIILETDNPNNDKYIERATAIFKSHGYADLKTIVLNKSAESGLVIRDNKTICFNIQNNINGLLSEYRDSIKEITSAASSFFFFLDNAEKLPELLHTIDLSELLIQREFPQTYYLLEENRIIRKNEQEMLFKIGLIQEQLDSVNDYQSFYNSSDTVYKRQIAELLSFYKNEYEILPLPYKRLGHLIKVIMGKRTFRSLFSDKVKKYKV